MTKAQASARAKKAWATRKANAAEAERKASPNYHIANSNEEKRAKRSARAVKAAATRKLNRAKLSGPIRGHSLNQTEKLVLATMRRRDLTAHIKLELIRTILEGL